MASGLRAGSDQGEGQWLMAGMVTEPGPRPPKALEGWVQGERGERTRHPPSVAAPRGELETGQGVQKPQAHSGEPSWMPQTRVRGPRARLKGQSWAR